MQILTAILNDQERFVLVDDEDYARCLEHKWYLNKHTGYMITGERPGMALHTFIVGPAPVGLLTDHINRNKLDNQKCNLRFVTPQLNGINSSSKRADLRHIYPTRFSTWTVRVTRDYKNILLGNYATIEEAKNVRDQFLANENLV